MGELDSYRCQAPVVLIVFNRPGKVRTLISVLKKVLPERVYVIADGPRDSHPNDRIKCAEVRQVISENIDWTNPVKIYSDKNLRGPVRVPSGLDEVFKNEDRAIILEDDCIPSLSFFRFCEELLERYSNSDEVGLIAGHNLEFSFTGSPVEGRHNSSYFFSGIPVTWGWATWARVWAHFDFDLSDYTTFKRNRIIDQYNFPSYTVKYWMDKFEKLYSKEINNWDYKFVYCLFKNHFLTAVSSKNLISNIGFDDSSTHFKKSEYFANRPSYELQLPLTHPWKMNPDRLYERRASAHFFTSNRFHKLFRLLRNKCRSRSIKIL